MYTQGKLVVVIGGVAVSYRRGKRWRNWHYSWRGSEISKGDEDDQNKK